jgi:pilus assembly protein CpaF
MIDSFEQQMVGEAESLLTFLRDDDVTDILINGLESLYVEEQGALSKRINPFSSESSVFSFIERLLIPISKSLDASAPYLDGRLLDGSRFNIVLPPLSNPGPLISIRKKKKGEHVSVSDYGPRDLMDWICEKVRKQKTFLISGGTGVGKTTFLAALIREVLSEERVVVLEEVLEIDPPHPHLIHLEARSPNAEGRGEVSLAALLRTALRMRPDRLILGECRGAEAFEMLQAMNTGHGGSLGTLHANSAQDALRKFESLVSMGGPKIPLRVIRDWIAHQVYGVIQMERSHGKRCVSEVLTLTGLEGEIYRVQPIYQKDRGGFSPVFS